MLLRYIRFFSAVIVIISITFILYLSTVMRSELSDKQGSHLLKNPLVAEAVDSTISSPRIVNSRLPSGDVSPHPNLRQGNGALVRHKNKSDNSVSYEVHAFYYPWYASEPFNGQWSHWDHKTIPHWIPDVNRQFPQTQHRPPNDIAAKFYPSLDPYASNDPSVIREHMKQLIEAGVGTLAISWYPPETKDDNAILFVDDFTKLIMDIADEFNEKVCFHLEPYKDRSAKSVREDLKYIISTYGEHPAFYRYKGKPLVYIYDSYIIPSSEWKDLLSPHGKISIRNTEWDVIAIGLFVNAGDCKPLSEGFFDGFYTYFASTDFVYGSTLAHWSTLKECAKKLRYPELFIPSVGPGYDDTVVRPWNNRNTKKRNNGDYYRRMWNAALQLNPAIVSITSFNEWHEGTQIEKVIKMEGYEDYGDDPSFYLKITREMVQKMK